MKRGWQRKFSSSMTSRTFVIFATYILNEKTTGRKRFITAVAALQAVQEFQPDLMILDLMLPGLDGWSICRQIRSHHSLPIIMLTARDSDADRIRGLELGADDYLVKPFNPRELVARVRAVLRRTQAAATDKSSSQILVHGEAYYDLDTRVKCLCEAKS